MTIEIWGWCGKCGNLVRARSNEMVINKELHLLRSRLSLAEKVVEAARLYPKWSWMELLSALRAYDAALQSAGEGK